MAYQAMLGSSTTASALPATGGAIQYPSSLPASLGPPSSYPPGLDPALVARYVIVLTISFYYLCLLLCPFLPFFQHFFPRFERFVQEGGDADFPLYLQTLLPDLLAYLDDPDLPGTEPGKPLRKRRSRAHKAAQDKREQEKLAEMQAQLNKVDGSPRETLGFQVPLPICY